MGPVLPVLLTLKRIMQFELLYTGSLDFFFNAGKELKKQQEHRVCETKLMCGLDLPRGSIHTL